MKTRIIALALALALVVVSISLVVVSNRTKHDNNQSNNNTAEAVYQNIMTRTSVRAFTNQNVETDKIEKLLRAGMAAPSAMDKRPWHFIVVTNPDQLTAIAQQTPNARMAARAPLAIVVCGDMNKEADGWERDYWIQDVSAATENILLAAHGMGLGAVWTGTWPSQERCAAVANIVGAPDNIIPFATIVIGYPEGEVHAKDKWDVANISYGTYGNTESAVADTASSKASASQFYPIDVQDEFHNNPFTFFADQLILCSGDSTHSNAMTIGWGALGNIWGHRPTLTVYVAPGRYTHQFMEKYPYFTVMHFQDSKVYDYMGSQSGRDGDKAQALGLHVAYTEHGTPYYEEADMVIECEVMYAAPFIKSGFRNDVPRERYANFPPGIHSAYIGEVVNAWKKN